MLAVTTIFAILVRIAATEKTYLSEIHEFPMDSRIIMDIEQPSNTSIIYARCDELPPSGKRCVVTTKLDAFDDSPGEMRECTVDVEPKSNGKVFYYMVIHGFGRDKVILVWTEMLFGPGNLVFYTTVIHMSDNCRTVEQKVRKYVNSYYIAVFNSANYQATVFDNKFEIVIGNVNDSCVANWKKCSLGEIDHYHVFTFDDQGRKVGEYWTKPLSSGTRAVFMPLKKVNQIEKGQFIQPKISFASVEFMNEKSSTNQQLKLWKNACKSEWLNYAKSLNNEAIGLCHICNNTVKCLQSDQKSRVLMQTEFTLNLANMTTGSSYNLRSGGILLHFLKPWYTEKLGNYLLSEYYDNYHLTKVDAKGDVKSIDGRFETRCPNFDCLAIMEVFENKKGQYCIIRNCQCKFIANPSGKHTFEIKTHCYSKEEFSK